MLWPDPVDRGHPLYYCIAVLVFRSRVPTMCQHHTQSGHSRIHPLLNSAKNICCSKKYLLWSTAADRCKVNNRKAILRGRRAATASIIPEAVSGSRRRKILPILSRSPHPHHRQGPAAAILPRLWPWQLDFNILSGRPLDCCCLTDGLVPGVTTVDIYTIYLQISTQVSNNYLLGGGGAVKLWQTLTIDWARDKHNTLHCVVLVLS